MPGFGVRFGWNRHEKVKADIEILELKKLQASKSLSKEDLQFISEIKIETLDFPKLKELIQLSTKKITLYNNYVFIEFSFSYGKTPRYTSRIHLTRTTPESDKQKRRKGLY